MLLPEISFKPSVISLNIAFLWFSEKLCVRTKAGYFDNPLENQRSKYRIVRDVSLCSGLCSASLPTGALSLPAQ